MRRILCALSLIATLFIVNAYAKNNNSPAGYWQQVSDTTNKPQSIIYLWLDKDNVLYGKVVSGFLVNGNPPKTVCTDCPTPFTDKPILNMQILWGFTAQEPGYWNGGHILDPNSAAIYRCNLTLQNNNNDLKVRGYIGISLFGRTQIWHRLTTEQALTLSKTAYQTSLTTS